jgi:hypothetical protein
MKRLVWLLIIVFGTALAQVSPVDLGVQNQTSCSCCETPGACGMPDCSPPPSSAPATTVAERPARTISAAARRNTARLYRVALHFLFPASVISITSRSEANATTIVSRVPLFKAHHSFLI